MFAVFTHVAWCRRDAETFLADGNGGVIDGLHVNIVLLKKQIGSLLRELRVSDKNGDDVGRVWDNRDIALGQRVLDCTGMELLKAAVALVFHLVLNSSFRARHGRGWEGGCEDESRS